MLSDAGNQKKIFEYHLELIPELQTIMQKRELEERCKFVKCNEICYEETKLSESDMYGMEIKGYDKTNISVHFKFRPVEEMPHIECGFILQFRKLHGKKQMRYLNVKYQELWNIELDTSTNFSQCAKKQFKMMLQKYQNTIKKLSISGFFFKFNWAANFGIDSLNSLECLLVHDDIDIQYFLSKIQNPLKILHVGGRENNLNLEECEHIYDVQDDLKLSVKFNNAQFLRLSAKLLHMSAENLTEDDIFNFIRSWQNDTIGKKVEFYTWSSCNFNVLHLVERLGIGAGRQHPLPIGFPIYMYDMQQYNDARKTGMLVYEAMVNVLAFRVHNDD